MVTCENVIVPTSYSSVRKEPFVTCPQNMPFYPPWTN